MKLIKDSIDLGGFRLQAYHTPMDGDCGLHAVSPGAKFN